MCRYGTPRIRHPVELAVLLLENLPTIEFALTEGAVAIFDRNRVRDLPITRGRD